MDWYLTMSTKFKTTFSNEHRECLALRTVRALAVPVPSLETGEG